MNDDDDDEVDEQNKAKGNRTKAHCDSEDHKREKQMSREKPTLTLCFSLRTRKYDAGQTFQWKKKRFPYAQVCKSWINTT